MALSDGLVGYWSPWLGSSGYRLLDRTRYANHGTLTNMDAGTDWVGATIRGRSGYALDFDGSNDYVPLLDYVSLDIMSAITISGWIYSTATSRYQGILTKRNGANGSGTQYGISKTNGNKLGFMYGGSYRELVSFSDIPLNSWAYVAVSVINSTLQANFFINGILDRQVSMVSPGITSQAGPVSIGRNNDSGFPEYYAGRISELKIHSRALANAEVLEDYRLGPGWYRPYQKRDYGYAAAGFKAYWHRRQSQLIGGGV